MTIVLSRSADHLYWMARQMERADNTARILDASYRMALLPQGQDADGASGSEWDAVLRISRDEADFHDRFSEIGADSVIRFMTLDPKNPSSIYSTIHAARENARAERVALTTEIAIRATIIV